MRRVRLWSLGAALVAMVVSLGLAPTAVAGPVVTDLPTLAITVPAAELAAVNADPTKARRAMINVEVTDPRNPSNNLVINTNNTEIKGRGNYTWTLPHGKKPYQIKFASGNAQNMLGMGTNRTWVLLANTVDASLMRNKVAMDLAAEFGMPFTTESRWVDLVINGRNHGNYLLAEKVEEGKSRVAFQDPQGVLIEQDYNYGTGDPVKFQLPRLKAKDSAGGYIVLKDAKSGNPNTLAELSTPAYANTKAGWDRFVSQASQLDTLLADPNANWGAISQIIDVDSFVKFFFVYEFAANQEVSRSSVHFYQDGAASKIYAGPVWDFDVTMGNFDDSLFGRGGNPEVDFVANSVLWRPDGKGSDWFPQLLKSTAFQQRIAQMYPELQPRINDVPSKIAGYRNYIEPSANANFVRWPNILGQRTLLPYGSRTYGSFNGEVNRLQNWTSRRVAYLNNKYAPGSPADPTSCSSGVPAGANTAAGTFNAVNPCRLLDTRTGNGRPGTVPIAAGGEVALQVTGRGGVPATASAVTLNVTVTAPQQPGFLIAYPTGEPVPTASNLNFSAQQTVPNAVVSRVGSDGRVTLRNGSTGTVHVIADLAGYFAGGGAATLPGSFQGTTALRLLDTRDAQGLTSGAAVAHNQEVALQVTGSHPAPTGAPVVVPQDASAVVLNVTAAATTAAGYLTAYPNGDARPVVSNLNFVKDQVAVPNLVTVKVGSEGKVNLYVATDPDPANGKSHVIVDIAGYYVGGTATAPGTFVALAPQRILDSRTGTGMVEKLSIPSLARRLNNFETISLNVTGPLNKTPESVAAAVMNVTVANPTAPGYVTVYPDGTPRPLVSSLNFVTDQVVPNLVTVRTGANGKVNMYSWSAGQTHLLADVAGYYNK